MRPDTLYSLRKPVARLLAIALALLLLSAGYANAQEAASAEPAPVTEPPPEEKPTVDLTSRSQEALSALDKLKGDLDQLGNSENAEEALVQLRGKVDDLLPEGQTIDDLAENPAAMDGVAVRSRAVTIQSTTLIENLTDGAKRLEELQAETRALIAQWELIQEESTEMPEALKERVAGILSSAKETEAQINEKLNRVIELQDASMAVRNLITPIAQRIDSYGKSQQTQIFERNVDPIWLITTDHITRSSERSTRRIAGNFTRDFITWVETSEASIGGHLLLLPLLLFLLFKLRSVAETTSSALNRPVATAILIWMLLGVVVLAGSPQVVRLVFVMTAMLVATVVLLNFLPQRMRRGVLVFAAVAIIHEIFQGQPVVEPMPRVAYAIIDVVLIVLAWLGRGQETKQSFIDWGAPRSLINSAHNAVILTLGVAFIANVAGYVVLGKHLTQGIIDSIAVFLILFAGFSSISEIIQIVLGLHALDNFRSIAANRYRLRRVLKKPLVWLSLILWAWATLIAFRIDDWVIGSVQSVFQAEMSIGDVTLSLRGIFVFVFAIWLAVWTSRVVRAVLNQDVLPRMESAAGRAEHHLHDRTLLDHHDRPAAGRQLHGSGPVEPGLRGRRARRRHRFRPAERGQQLRLRPDPHLRGTHPGGRYGGGGHAHGPRDADRHSHQPGAHLQRLRGDRAERGSGFEPGGQLDPVRSAPPTAAAVGVAYGTDPNLVTEVLKGVLEADEEVLSDPEPLIVFNRVRRQLAQLRHLRLDRRFRCRLLHHASPEHVDQRGSGRCRYHHPVPAAGSASHLHTGERLNFSATCSDSVLPGSVIDPPGRAPRSSSLETNVVGALTSCCHKATAVRPAVMDARVVEVDE